MRSRAGRVASDWLKRCPPRGGPVDGSELRGGRPPPWRARSPRRETRRSAGPDARRTAAAPRAAARGSRSRSARRVSASTSSQPRMISSARARPTSRGRRWVPLPPGMIPSATSGWASTRAAERGEAHVQRRARARCRRRARGPRSPRWWPWAWCGSGRPSRGTAPSSAAASALPGRQLLDQADVGVRDEELRVRRCRRRPPRAPRRRPRARARAEPCHWISARSKRLIGGWSIVACTTPPSIRTFRVL